MRWAPTPTSSSFLLDPTYAGLLSPAEQQLARTLHRLSDDPAITTADDDLPAGARVRQLLGELGAPGFQQ